MLLAAHDAEVVAANDTPAAQLMMPHVSDSEVPHVSDSEVPHLSPSMVDTPIKQDSTTLLPFTTYTRCRVDTLNAMGREMKSHIVGPMPPEEFLRLFLPISQIPHYDDSSFTSAFNAGIFKSTIDAPDEQHAYKPFVSVPAPVTFDIIDKSHFRSIP
jgi:hypothetical protein